jgi:hypothetical protein
MIQVQTGNMLDVVVEGKSLGLKQRSSDEIIWLPDPDGLRSVLEAEINRLNPSVEASTAEPQRDAPSQIYVTTLRLAVEIVKQSLNGDDAIAKLEALIDSPRTAVATPNQSDEQVARHPENYCHRCGGRNISWFAPSLIWNEAVRDKGEPGIICPLCFVELAALVGYDTTWAITPDNVTSDYDEQLAKRAARRIVTATVQTEDEYAVIVRDALVQSAAALAAARSQVTQDGWRPIESAPEMRTVLLWADTSTPDLPNWRMGSGVYDSNLKVWIWEGEQVRGWAFPPTHWQPLPPPPSQTEEK